MKIIKSAAVFAFAMILFAATNTRADHTNTHTNVIPCDFTVLEGLVDDLEIDDIQAPNNNARRGRLNSLENALDDALDAVDNDDVQGVREALKHIAKKAEDRKNAWLTGDVAEDITDAIDDLLDCLAALPEDDDDDEEVPAPGEGCFDDLTRGNGRNVVLDAGTYDCDLVLRGNNNRIVGSATGDTIIDGNVVITGNNNVLSNVEVTGTITLRGNRNGLNDVEHTTDVVSKGNRNEF